MTTNPHEASARQRKADRLIAVLRQAGADSAAAASMDATGRRLAARAAGVNMPSEETWAVVVHEMRRAERAPRFVPEDPFACFHGGSA